MDAGASLSLSAHLAFAFKRFAARSTFPRKRVHQHLHRAIHHGGVDKRVGFLYFFQEPIMPTRAYYRAVIFFVASQIASTFRLDTNQDSADGESGGRLLQYATLVVGVLIVCVSLYMARVFCRLTKLSAPTATQRTRPTRPVPQLTGITSL